MRYYDDTNLLDTLEMCVNDESENVAWSDIKWHDTYVYFVGDVHKVYYYDGVYHLLDYTDKKVPSR